MKYQDVTNKIIAQMQTAGASCTNPINGVKTAMKWFNDYHRPGEPYKGTIDGYHRMKGEFDAIFKSMYKAA